MTETHTYLGRPVRDGDPHYGLLQNTMGCFLGTTENLWAAHHTSNLLSSRYRTVVIDLTTAQNYYPGIIDNTVCENWTIAWWHPVNLKISSHDQAEWIDELTPADAANSTDQMIQKEKKWAQFVLSWTLRLGRIYHDHIPNYEQQLLMMEIFDVQGSGFNLRLQTISEIRKAIDRMLFFGDDPDRCETEIQRQLYLLEANRA